MSLDWKSTLLYVTALLIALLGIVVFLRNSAKRLHFIFLCLTISAALWVASNAVFWHVTYGAAYGIGLASYAFAAAVAIAVFYFAAEIAHRKVPRWMLWLGILFAGSSALPGLLATGVTAQGIQTTPLLYGYAAGLLGYFGTSLWWLGQLARVSRGLIRRQARFMLSGFALSILGGTFCNLLLPLIGDYQLVDVGPSFTLVLIATLFYAIVRHRLFNVRLAIARTITYVLLLLTLASAYALSVFAATQLFFGSSSVSVGQNAINVLFAVFLAFTFDPLRRLFRRMTNKFFFHDIYITDLVLDDLSDVLVHTTSLVDLVHRSLHVLNQALKSENAGIVVIDKQTGAPAKTVGIGRHRVHADALVASMTLDRRPIIVLDEIEEVEKHLFRQMTDAGVAVLVRLETSGELIGYAAFGYKSGGGIYTSQDLDLISIAADELAVAIQNALRFEEIAHFNETLQEQVRQATAELRESNKKLKSLDEAKDEFISMASHQLRTPLTSVKGYLSMVLEGDAGNLNPTQHQLLDQAFASAQRMVYLISDFLNVSRLQTGKFSIERTPVVLSDLVQQEVKQLQSTATSRNLTIECNVPSNFPALQLDESKLRQAIMNFIDNAIFYSPPGSVIKVDLVKTAKEAVLTVQDNGIGVPASERHRLFTKFYRASNARTTRPDGTGIGLFMARKVVVAHRGSMIFSSVEGKGSTFGFRLPLHQPTSEDHAEKLDQQPEHK